MVEKNYSITQLPLVVITLPFYFVGFFLIKTSKGHVIGTLAFLRYGLLGSSSFFDSYFDQIGKGMATIVAVLLIISLLLEISLVVSLLLDVREKPTLTSCVFKAVITSLSSGLYLGAAVLTFVFFTKPLALLRTGGSGGLCVAVLIPVVLFTFNTVVSVHEALKSLSADITLKQGETVSPVNNPGSQFISDAIKPAEESKVESYYIVFCNGDYGNARIPIRNSESIVLGRDGEFCQLVFSNSKISRKHCEITRLESHFYIRDFSKNGVFRVRDGSRLLADGFLNRLEPREVISLANTNNWLYCTVEKC